MMPSQTHKIGWSLSECDTDQTALAKSRFVWCPKHSQCGGEAADPRFRSPGSAGPLHEWHS
jgi:hypothetical protein